MDKRYKFAVNGKTYFKNVSSDNEQKFFDLYGKYNPVLVPNEPSKSIQETDQSQRNQKKDNNSEAYFTANQFNYENAQKANEGKLNKLKYKLDSDGTRMYLDPKSNEYKREVKYDYDRSTGVRFDQDSYGKILDNVAYGTDTFFKAIKTLRGNEEEKAKTKLLVKNRVDNIPENLYRWAASTVAGFYDLKYTKPNYAFGYENRDETKEEKEKREKQENTIIKMYENLDQMQLDKDGVKTKFGTLKLKDSGVGIVKGAKQASPSDVIAGVFGAGVSMAETFIPAVLTSGRSLPFQIAAPMYTDYNQAKAKQLYGDEPDAVERLIRDNKTELTTPLVLGAVATGLEYVGFKGIQKYIASIPGKSGLFANLFLTGNREGWTEVGQLVVEKLNTELGTGKSIEEASISTYNTMTSDEVFEMYLNGFLGATQMSVAGKTVNNINRAVRGDEATTSDINNKISNIANLNLRKNTTKNKKAKEAIDIEIKAAEQDLKDYIIKTRNISKVLNNEQKQSLTNILKEKDNIDNKINDLNLELQKGNITRKEYGYAVRSLNNQNKRLSNQIVDIKKQVLEAASKRQVEAVKKQIEEIGLEGKITEMTAEEISKMDLGKTDAKRAAGEFGFIKQFKDGSFEIVINKDKPTLGTAAHEFLHAVLNTTLSKNKNTQNALAAELIKHTSKLKSEGTENLSKRLDEYKDDAALGEEVITVMSESIMDGSLKYDDGFFTRIGDIVRRFLQNTGLKEVRFDTGRDVYNFIKDYNESIKTGKVNKAIIKVAKEGAKGKLVERTDAEIKADEIKFSKDSKPDVDKLAVDPATGKNYTQSEWDRVGADRAIEALKERDLMDNLIAAKYKVKDVPPSFVDDVLGSREFLNMINRFNRGRRGVKTGPNKENESLFGYIQGQLRFRADDIFKEAGIGKVPKGTKVRELDATRPEGQPKAQLEDTGDTTIQRIDEQEINLRDEQTHQTKPEVRERKSKFRNEIGITRKGKVFREVKKALRTAASITDPKKFLKTFEKTVSDSLFNFMKNYFPDTTSMIKYREAILESIPVSTLVQMQKQLPEKIFVKNYGRLTNKTQISDFVYGRNESGKNPSKKKLLTEEILDDSQASKDKRKAGVPVYERLKPTSTQWKNYLEATERGKRQKAAKSGTKGNNRIKILEESAKAIGRDATPENLTTDFLEDYIQEKGLEGKLTVDQVREEINKTIDRPSDLKFSKKPKQKADNFKTSANKNINDIASDRDVAILKVIKKIQEYTSRKSGKTKSRAIVDFIKSSKLSKDVEKHIGGFLSIHPEYIPFFQDSMTGGYDNGLFGVKDIFYKVLGIKDTNRKKVVEIKLDNGEIVKISLSRFKYSKTGRILDTAKMNKIKDSKKHLAANKARINFLEGLIKNLFTYIKTNPDSKSAIVMFFKDGSKHQNHMLRYLAPLVGATIDPKTKKFIEVEITEEHGQPQNEINTMILDLLLDTNSTMDDVNDLVKFIRSSYSQWGLKYIHDNKIDEAGYTESTPQQFYEEVLERLYEGKLDYLPDGVLLPIFRYIESGFPLNTYYMFEVGQTITEFFGVDIKNASEIDMEYLAPIQNKLIKEILLGKIDRKTAKKRMNGVVAVGHKNSVKKIKNINNARKAKSSVIKNSKSGKTKGMSTFDFDETLIIDGENFVVATDPKTGETLNIKSGDWPVRGPELAAAGYTFNFDDFVNVRGGVDGPLLQKMKNQIKKYGPENVFVLTARPQTADVAIHEWLKSKGIKIPFKNITGLAKSEGQAKADWMLEKFAEGYNDMYFVDDALPNVEAVKNVLEQLDIKSKVVQAKIKFSKQAPLDLNKILEETKGVNADRKFTASEAMREGARRSRFKFFVPPSAEDFKGLLYSFLGKGRKGDAHMKFFKETLLDPYAKGYREWNAYKQAMSDDYQQVKKQFKNVGKKLKNKVRGTSFDNEAAIRVYLWNKAGYEIPGINEEIQNKLVEQIENNPDLKAFAEALSVTTRIEEGYIEPNEFWAVESIASDLTNAVNKIGRKQFLAEWMENKNIIFSPEGLNKIEAIYGTDFRDALENILYRMETGTNRVIGKDKTVNKFLDWINGSVGAVMFFNIRSAALQTISTINFINASDNNMFRAAAAFANQPQFWKDFSFIFNSSMLKQRRAGLQIDVSASELTKVFADSGNKSQAVINWLLEKGFKPTQIADSFAISAGGATFYRNRIKKYIKEGMSEAKAKEQAFLDFQEMAEETQQSSRPDLISAQQAGVLGRIILAWQNTPMQMTRLTKKSISDLVNRRRIKGLNQFQSDKANISRIMYYGLIQNLIFGALQTGLAFLLFGWDEDEERKKKLELRVANGALDTILRGTGVYGAAVSTLKNTLMKWRQESQKGWKRDDLNIALEAISLSPPLGSKLRKIISATRTEKYNKGVSEEIGFRIENPNISIAANWTEALLNIPVARVVNKANNVEEAITGNHDIWQRVALISGWNRWDIGVKDEELEEAKQAVKDKKKKKKQTTTKKVRCVRIKSNGQRCKNKTDKKNKRCYAHQ